MYVNLLPMSFLRRLTIRRQAWNWGICVAVTSLLCIVVVAAQYFAVLATQQLQFLTALQSQELHAVQADTQRISSELASLDAVISSLKKTRPDDRTLALLGIASTSAKKATGKVQLKQLMTQTAPTVKSASLPPTPGPPSRNVAESVAPRRAANDFVLEGVADSAAAIASFVDALREAKVFTRVDLTATSETATSGGPTRQFRIDCKF